MPRGREAREPGRLGEVSTVETHKLIAFILAVVALIDVTVVPAVLNRRLQGSPQYLIVMLALFSGAVVMAGLAAAFWFRWIPI